MAISFPASPTVGQTYTVGNIAWTWNGSSWDALTLVNGTATGSISASYLVAQNNADQNSVGNGTALAFQTTLASSGSLITKGSNTQITLAAGQSYKLEGIVRRFTSSSTWGAFQWYDVTNSAYIGAAGFGECATSVVAVGSTVVATAYVTPVANTTYELRQNTANTISVTAAYATIEVTQLNPSFALAGLNSVAASGDVTAGGNASGKYLVSTNATGDEGGEIQLAKPPNATISGGVTIDAYQNKVRIFEQGGSARGVSLDLSKAPTGVGGELTWKVSNYVNAGTFVTLDNIKASVTTSGQRGLCLATVSGSITYTIGASFGYVNGAGGGSSNGSATLTTTPTASFFGWSFPDAGAMSIYIVTDITNSKTYRITLQIGGGYNNNFISIERL